MPPPVDVTIPTSNSNATSAVADSDAGSDAVDAARAMWHDLAQGLSPVATSEVQGLLDRDGRDRESSSCEALAINGSATWRGRTFMVSK